MNNPATLAQKLRLHRKQRGYSLDQLAKLAGCSKSYLWELENRETRKPSAAKLSEIAMALGVTTDYLMHGAATLDDSARQEALYRKFSSLSAKDRGRLEQIINNWLEESTIWN